MERRDEGRGNSMSSQMGQESAAVKLPLAPIVSTPPDRRGNNAATVSSSRRGSSIFSPTQTLDHNPPPPQPNHLPPPQHHQKEVVNPDPDPAQTPTGPTTGTAAPNLKNPTEDQNTSSTTTAVVKYRECQKNHAASMGGHVVDGCGEFMPGGDEGTPESLRCAACDCHRNFHRKETENRNSNSHQAPPQNHHGQHNRNSNSYPHGRAGPTMVDFGGGGPREDPNVRPSYSSGSKKRFRTKFSQEQKDKMHDLAERLGWRMQKQSEGEVQQFCNEVGVKRQVFKVWMHNNKQAMEKKKRGT